MTSMTSTHLLLFALVLSTAAGRGLEERKGPLENKVLDVPEGTPPQYPIYQFRAADPDVTEFRLSGETEGKIMISDDGWLYLEEALDWALSQVHTLEVEALVDLEVVEGPFTITINVLDINNHTPFFNQTDYTAVVREGSPAGVPFARVFASDHDDPESANARLSYSLVKQIPNKQNTLLFQINSVTGEISTTPEGERLLTAREGIMYSKGENGHSNGALQRKFDEYCTPNQDIPYELNPFYNCVERAELRRMNPMDDPDYTLIVRVEDLGGASENALGSNARVNIGVEQNHWVNPGPITVEEQLERQYPMHIAQVQSNEPSALYRLEQKERELHFPFIVTEEGEIQLTEQLDREQKDRYILVVFAEDHHGNEVDPPMEVHVLVSDVNDNMPVCEEEETVFEVQENELAGSLVGQLMVHDADDPETANALLTYTVLSQTSSATFTIDDATGRIQTRQTLNRKEGAEYHLTVRVSDPAFSTDCKVLIKIIDVNNELPMFEKNDYGSLPLSEDTAIGHTLLTLRATDADEPGTGSARIEFYITSGDDNSVFAVETDGNGEARLVIAKALDFETSPSYRLQIDARNPEPLMAGLEYGPGSSAFVSVDIGDVDEVPEFDLDILNVAILENVTVGTVLLKVDAKDPEGKEIGFKLEGDSQGWLEIDPATGDIKSKAKLDRETLEAFEVTVTVFEKAKPEQSSERVVSVHLLDVNDNAPKLLEKQAFICVKKPQPVILTAQDTDSAPFSQPFTFTLAQARKSPNWDLHTVDGMSAKLTLKKSPSEDKTFLIPINIKDNAGMGVTHKFEVRVCNCTSMGYCYTEPGVHEFKYGMGPTIGILAGTIGFIILLLMVVFNRIKKDNQKKALEQGDTDAML